MFSVSLLSFERPDTESHLAFNSKELKTENIFVNDLYAVFFVVMNFYFLRVLVRNISPIKQKA